MGVKRTGSLTRAGIPITCSASPVMNLTHRTSLPPGVVLEDGHDKYVHGHDVCKDKKSINIKRLKSHLRVERRAEIVVDRGLTRSLDLKCVDSRQP